MKTFRYDGEGWGSPAGDPYPSTAWLSGRHAGVSVGDTAFGFAIGSVSIKTGAGKTFTLYPSMYFCVPGAAVIDGQALIVIRRNYSGLFNLGGPIEAAGRLRYIDGCTDTLLVSPPLKGDPCLNHLHFPPGINQTAHTHPTVRLGIVARGRGECVTPDGVIPLEPGFGWAIPPGGVHAFRTLSESMDVIAYHPDSDFGPEHDDHPMINRTYVNGVSASGLDDIKTKVG